MESSQRIVQWENMTQADPDNSMGWMSLGSAYKDADRLEDAAGALRKAIEIDDTLSRAYQVLGQVLIKLDQGEQAGELLTKGYSIAARQGDVMPQRAMGSLLEQLGLDVPQVASAAPEPAELTGDQIIDRRTGHAGTKIAEPPLRTPLGKFIAAHFTQETWREWIGMGTKVINEFRLDFSNPEHQKVYNQQMMEWLGISQEEVDAFAASAEGK